MSVSTYTISMSQIDPEIMINLKKECENNNFINLSFINILSILG